MSRIGLTNLYYALLTKDDSTGATYSAPKRIPGAISVKDSPKTDTAKLYADDALAETATSLGEIDLEFEVKDIPPDLHVELFGGTIDANGVMHQSKSDIAPLLAIGMETPKSNGNSRFFWLLKGRLEQPEQEAKTKEDKITFQTVKIKGTFMTRDFDGKWRFIGDEDQEDFAAAVATWFNQVYTPPAPPAP